jgi:glycosyltransferase involved in cell wall biosynthesis
MQTLSIIIPTMNEEDYLPILLTSLKAQNYKPLETIVADAHSTDRTREIAREAGAKIVEGGMPGAGRNNGAEVARGGVLLFLDADILFPDKTFLEKVVKEFEERRLGIATVSIAPIQSGRVIRFAHDVYNFYLRLAGSRRPHAPGFFILVKRDIHEQMKGFDESILYAEDQDYAVRAAKIGAFGFLSRDLIIQVSTRRIKRDGILKTLAVNIFAEIYMLFLGPIRTDIFKYRFGYKKK